MISRDDIENAVRSLLKNQEKDYILSLLFKTATTYDLCRIIDIVLGRYESDVKCAGEDCTDCKAPCKTGEPVEDTTQKDEEKEKLDMSKILEFQEEASKINPMDYCRVGKVNLIQKLLNKLKGRSADKTLGQIVIEKDLTEDQITKLSEILD